MFRQVVGTILRLADRYADHWLPDPRQPRRPGLRLRADHRAAAARGEHAPAPVRVPRRLADPRRHVALDARAGDRRRRSSSSRPRPARSPMPPGPSSASAGTWRPRRPPPLEMAEAVSAFHFPDDLWARVVYDLVVAARDPKPSLETLVAALVPIYFGRVGSFVIENRNVTTDAGRGAGRAPGARVRAAQAVPRRALGRRRPPTPASRAHDRQDAAARPGSSSRSPTR